MLDRLFKLKEHNTDVKTEVLAGITSFIAMAYIIFVNPSILKSANMDFNSVLMATCIGAAVGCFLTAILANVPFCQAPGMGMNAFFAYTLCGTMGYTWQQGLTVVFLSGAIFLLITITPLRGKIIAAIPNDMKNAITGGIGLFVALVGLFNAGIVHTTEAGKLTLGNIAAGAPLVAVIGLLIVAVLVTRRVKGALILGILAATAIAVPLGVATLPETLTLSGLSMEPTFMKMSFDFSSVGIVSVVTVVATLAVYNTFDTLGTLIATATNAGLVDKDGNMPGCDRALIADAGSTILAGFLGTSTICTLVESTTGISEGGRTGLTAIVCGVLFLLGMLLAPVAEIIPAAATAPALILSGTMMAGGVRNIDWKDMEIAIPCFLILAIMPFAYSVSDGIGFGFISYIVIKIFRGKAREVSPVLHVLGAIFVIKYILAGIL